MITTREKESGITLVIKHENGDDETGLRNTIPLTRMAHHIITDEGDSDICSFYGNHETNINNKNTANKDHHIVTSEEDSDECSSYDDDENNSNNNNTVNNENIEIILDKREEDYLILSSHNNSCNNRRNNDALMVLERKNGHDKMITTPMNNNSIRRSIINSDLQSSLEFTYDIFNKDKTTAHRTINQEQLNNEEKDNHRRKMMIVMTKTNSSLSSFTNDNIYHSDEEEEEEHIYDRFYVYRNKNCRIKEDYNIVNNDTINKSYEIRKNINKIANIETQRSVSTNVSGESIDLNSYSSQYMYDDSYVENYESMNINSTNNTNNSEIRRLQHESTLAKTKTAKSEKNVDNGVDNQPNIAYMRSVDLLNSYLSSSDENSDNSKYANENSNTAYTGEKNACYYTKNNIKASHEKGDKEYIHRQLYRAMDKLFVSGKNALSRSYNFDCGDTKTAS